MKKIQLVLASLMCIALLSSCGDDEPEDPIIPNQEEVITTLTYTLTPEGGGTPVVFSFVDLDGDGGDEPVLTEGTLAANSSYTGALKLLNEQESPAEDISDEVAEEADEHQFFFESTIVGLSVAYTDADANNKPIGLATTVATTESGTGTLTIVLRHEPAKDAEGVSEGDISNAGGETDIEVTFNVDVE